MPARPCCFACGAPLRPQPYTDYRRVPFVAGLAILPACPLHAHTDPAALDGIYEALKAGDPQAYWRRVIAGSTAVAPPEGQEAI